MSQDTIQTRPPREDLFRALPAGIELKRAVGDAAMPTLAGHFAVFGQWTEINSMWEGNFLERIAKGAFTKTIAESRDQMRVLFNHGQDPQIGDKVLGKISELREDANGPYYEVPLLDTSYNRDLIPALEAGQYGASFRFKVMREEMDDSPDPSDENPRGLPQRTIKEAAVSEFGPVTFPAYAGATAGLRSLCDEFLIGRFLGDEDRLTALLEARKRPLQVAVPESTAFGDVAERNLSGLSDEERADMPSVSLLTQMYELGEEFIEIEDAAEDAADREAMTAILGDIEKLVKAEADEPADVDETNAAEQSGSTRGDSAATAHPVQPRRTSLAINPTTLEREESPSWIL